MKKIKFKKWVKISLYILLAIIIEIILLLILMKGSNDFDELANRCDQDKGYTCSYYEIRQYR